MNLIKSLAKIVLSNDQLKEKYSGFSILCTPIIRIRTLGHVAIFFGPSGKNTLRALEFCYRRKKSCCMNDFPECYNAFSNQYGT